MPIPQAVTNSRAAAEAALQAVQTAQANMASAIDTFLNSTLPSQFTSYAQAAQTQAGAAAAANMAEAVAQATTTIYAIPPAHTGAGHRAVALRAYRAYQRATPGAPLLP